MKNIFDIDEDIIDYVENIEKTLEKQFSEIEKLEEINFYKVLRAMQEAGLSEAHFMPSTGYGYDDLGRDALERIFASIFKTESALVRPHIASGTHAIACALYGVLRPGDTLLSITGPPYDTVKTFIDAKSVKGCGSLADLGINYVEIPLMDNGQIDLESVLDALNKPTKIVYIQRSSGYSGREALTLDKLKSVIEQIKNKKSDVVIFLDNCYGEFLDEIEPGEIGVDLLAGSLIKNPGGGIAPTGGYVAGREDLVALAAARLTAPGISSEVGATLSWTKYVLQGLFLAPQVVAGALRGVILMSACFKNLGFKTLPDPNSTRSDIIQIIELGSKEAVEIFCRAVQEAAPVNSFVTPIAETMPGYEDPVIMAAGSFIQGSSIELSADAPIREPYRVYFQGGLSYYHAKIAVLLTMQRLKENAIINV